MLTFPSTSSACSPKSDSPSSILRPPILRPRVPARANQPHPTHARPRIEARVHRHGELPESRTPEATAGASASTFVSAFIKNGIQNRYDIESALSYVAEKMLMPTSDSGDPRITLFGGFDEAKPYTPGFNPLQAGFHAILEICREQHQERQNSSPSSGRTPSTTVASAWGEVMTTTPAPLPPTRLLLELRTKAISARWLKKSPCCSDAKSLLTGCRWFGLLQAIIAGQNTQQQRVRFGDRVTKMARPIIVQKPIRDYAQSSGNDRLLSLLDKFKDFRANQATPGRRVVKANQNEITGEGTGLREHFVGLGAARVDPGGQCQSGRYRRRWLDYPAQESGVGVSQSVGRSFGCDGQGRRVEGDQDDRGSVGVCTRPMQGHISRMWRGDTLVLGENLVAAIFCGRFWRIFQVQA